MAESNAEYHPSERARGTIREAGKLVAALEQGDIDEARNILEANRAGWKAGFGNGGMVLTRL